MSAPTPSEITPRDRLSAFSNRYLPIADDSDERYAVTGVSWEAYESLLEDWENCSPYRISYLDGVLELVSPGRRHEVSKGVIGGLLEAYLQETRTRYIATGSWTLKKREVGTGKEPDESYCLGSNTDGFPDLAIEVVESSGGTQDVEKYRRLEIQEIWFWQDNKLSVYCLEERSYERRDRSQVLPALDLSLLEEHIRYPDPFTAILDFREKIRAS